MKNFFLMLAFLSLLMILPCFAQQKIPVITDSTFFYADSLSQTINLGKNEFLVQAWVDANRTASLKVQFWDTGKQQWSWLQDDGSNYTATFDSTANNVIVFPPWLLLAAKDIRLIISNDPADTLSMRYDKRPY